MPRVIQRAADIPAGAGGIAVAVEPGQTVIGFQLPAGATQVPEAFAAQAHVGLQRQAKLHPCPDAGIPVPALVLVAQPAQTDHRTVAAGRVIA